MSIAKNLNAFLDEIMTEGIRRVRVESEELQAIGIVDAEGNLLISELPEDMASRSTTMMACTNRTQSAAVLLGK